MSWFFYALLPCSRHRHLAERAASVRRVINEEMSICAALRGSKGSSEEEMTGRVTSVLDSWPLAKHIACDWSHVCIAVI